MCRHFAQHCENVEDLEADLRSAANMQQITKKLLPKIAVRRSRRKSELQTKEFVLTDLHVDERLETENQVQEMAIG